MDEYPDLIHLPEYPCVVHMTSQNFGVLWRCKTEKKMIEHDGYKFYATKEVPYGEPFIMRYFMREGPTGTEQWWADEDGWHWDWLKPDEAEEMIRELNIAVAYARAHWDDHT